MTYVLVNTRIPFLKTFRNLSVDAQVAYYVLVSWLASRWSKDGAIATVAWSSTRIADKNRRKIASELVSAGLWEHTGQGDYRYCNYTVCQDESHDDKCVGHIDVPSACGG